MKQIGSVLWTRFSVYAMSIFMRDCTSACNLKLVFFQTAALQSGPALTFVFLDPRDELGPM